jgi:hypothetical protein
VATAVAVFVVIGGVGIMLRDRPGADRPARQAGRSPVAGSSSARASAPSDPKRLIPKAGITGGRSDAPAPGTDPSTGRPATPHAVPVPARPGESPTSRPEWGGRRDDDPFGHHRHDGPHDPPWWWRHR